MEAPRQAAASKSTSGLLHRHDDRPPRAGYRVGVEGRAGDGSGCWREDRTGAYERRGTTELELLADRLKIIQALLEGEVLEIIGAELVPQECAELLVLLQEGVLEVGAIDVMAMLDLVDHGRELAGDLAV